MSCLERRSSHESSWRPNSRTSLVRSRQIVISQAPSKRESGILWRRYSRNLNSNSRSWGTSLRAKSTRWDCIIENNLSLLTRGSQHSRKLSPRRSRIEWLNQMSSSTRPEMTFKTSNRNSMKSARPEPTERRISFKLLMMKNTNLVRKLTVSEQTRVLPWANSVTIPINNWKCNINT